MGNVLQRTHIGLWPRGAAADEKHGRAGERGIRHRGDAIGYARAGGDHGDAELARQLRMGMGHVDGRALVSHVDDADALAAAEIPDRLDMAALQAEDAVDAARL